MHGYQHLARGYWIPLLTTSWDGRLKAERPWETTEVDPGGGYPLLGQIKKKKVKITIEIIKL